MKCKVIVAAVAAFALSASAASACHPTSHPKPKPKVHKTIVVKKPVQGRLVPPVTVIIDRPVVLSEARLTRAGYCINGVFTDLVLGQVEADEATITWARFYKGVGITCDHLPGYEFQNEYVDAFGGIGNYAYFA